MNIKKCYEFHCDREHLSCFADCNNMYVNILILKELHDKLTEYENLLNDDSNKKFDALRQDFQNKFKRLVENLENDFSKLVNENMEYMKINDK